MKQLTALGVLAVLLTALPARESKALALDGNVAGDKATTFAGWFSDEDCAPGRLKADVIGPSNPECSKRCIESGKAAVFISEKEKAVFHLAGYTHAKDDLGWHVEITGTLDDGSKTLSVQSVKRLEYTGAMCGRPVKKASSKK